MRRRQPLPRLWLMTDERMGDGLGDAVRALPRGSGVVFRHHATPGLERRRLFDLVRAQARRRGLAVVVAGELRQAAGWRADGAHGRAATKRCGLLKTWPAHDVRELIAGVKAGADVVFLSPAFATRSHPGGRGLGPVRFGLSAKLMRRSACLHMSPCRRPETGEGRCKRPLLVALGGMDAPRYRRLKQLGAQGWAAIDALAPDQKRKVVPK